MAHALIKDSGFRDNPQTADLAGVTHPRDQFRCFEHRYDLEQPESLEIYRDWRRIAERYDTALIGETYVLTPTGLANLVPGDGLHLGFWFAPMQMPWTAADIARTLRETSELLGDRVGWVQSSHDESRPATRFGGGDFGRSRSLAFAAMLFGLPGVPFIYQGEELGLEDGDVPPGTAFRPDRHPESRRGGTRRVPHPDALGARAQPRFLDCREDLASAGTRR